MQPSHLEIVDTAADQRFRVLARKISLDPDDVWVGGYVNYQWTHDRYLLEQYDIGGKDVLEFGCNTGATAVVLAHLGARVTAVDVNATYVALGRVNAERYGVAQNIQFLHVPDTTKLPFATESFDLVTAMSVLEYVPSDRLPDVQKEIDRVVRRGGIILVTGTSSRLWPKEVHSGRWLVNYLPLAVDSLLSLPKPLQRGIFPQQVRHGFGAYVNLDLQDQGATYLEAKAKMERSAAKLQLLHVANRLLNKLGLSVGLCMPSIAVALRKAS